MPDLQLEFEYQLDQQTRLTVLEDADLLQGVQVNMDGDLSFEFVR